MKPYISVIAISDIPFMTVNLLFFFCGFFVVFFFVFFYVSFLFFAFFYTGMHSLNLKSLNLVCQINRYKPVTLESKSDSIRLTLFPLVRIGVLSRQTY